MAACDKEILGKTLKHGEIEFTVSEKFYFGEGISGQKLGEMLDEFSNINLVGEKCVGVALKKGLITEKNIIDIAGIPHAQIFII